MLGWTEENVNNMTSSCTDNKNITTFLCLTKLRNTVLIYLAQSHYFVCVHFAEFPVANIRLTLTLLESDDVLLRQDFHSMLSCYHARKIFCVSKRLLILFHLKWNTPNRLEIAEGWFNTVHLLLCLCWEWERMCFLCMHYDPFFCSSSSSRPPYLTMNKVNIQNKHCYYYYCLYRLACTKKTCLNRSCKLHQCR